MFEDEIIHVISGDPSVERVVVIDNGEQISFVEKLENRGLSPSVVSGQSLSPEQMDGRGLSVVVCIQSIGYHANPGLLKEESYENIGYLSDFCDGILLFYGMCGRAFEELESDFRDRGCVIHVLEDPSTGLKVDDCIACALGSNECYHRLLEKQNKSLFFTPMWASRWDMMFGNKGIPKRSMGSLFKKTGFNRLFKIDTGLYNEQDFQKNIDDFADTFEFDVIEIKGSSRIAEHCYSKIKDEIRQSRPVFTSEPVFATG